MAYDKQLTKQINTAQHSQFEIVALLLLLLFFQSVEIPFYKFALIYLPKIPVGVWLCQPITENRNCFIEY